MAVTLGWSRRRFQEERSSELIKLTELNKLIELNIDNNYQKSS